MLRVIRESWRKCCKTVSATKAQQKCLDPDKIKSALIKSLSL